MVESLKLKAALLGRLASESKPPAVPSDLFVGK